MNFKKILVTLLASALLLSACGKSDETIGGADGPTDITVSDTAAEENTETSEPAGVIASADDVISFIDNDVYPQCPAESLPMMLMSMAIPIDDMETVTYHTGLTDLTGISDIIISESGVGSIAMYSAPVQTHLRGLMLSPRVFWISSVFVPSVRRYTREYAMEPTPDSERMMSVIPATSARPV